jgi:hypothetical protein
MKQQNEINTITFLGTANERDGMKFDLAELEEV